MSRISIFGYYGQSNAGDEAILSALTKGLKKAMPNTKIAVYSASPKETATTHNVESYNFFMLNPKTIIKSLIRKSRFSFIKAVLNFFKTDVVVIGGGGLYFDTEESNQWIFGYINLIHFAKRYGKKVALCGISVGPLHHQSSKDAIAKAFIRADLITVRDNLSKELLSSIGVPAEKINVIPDLVFTFDSSSPEKINAVLKAEGIPKTSTQIVAFAPCCYNSTKEGWLEQYVALCEKIITTLNVHVWMVPLQRHETFDDLSAANSIYKNLSSEAKEKCFVVKGIYTPDEVQGVLSKADFVFAERLHGSIMALNTNTPFLGIAYMQKVSGVLELANLPERIIPIKDFLSGKFLEQSYEAIKEELSTVSTSKNLNAGIREKALKNFELLKQLTQS